MTGSNPIETMSLGVDDANDADGDAVGDAGWSLVAEYDGAAPLVGAILRLDEGAEYTKTELSDRAGVAYKTLYLDGTVEALVEAGLLESTEQAGEETTFSVDADSPVYDAAMAFDDVLRGGQ